MTRSKATPSVHKPVFDEESVLRFAARDPDHVAGGNIATIPPVRKGGKDPGADRISITLMLKLDVIALLKEEAARKEKKIDQIVEKLVTKHLGKH